MIVFQALLIAAVAAATPQADAAPVTRTAADDKPVCKRIVPTGSIMAKRICLTKKDWQRFNTQNGDNAEEALRHRGTGMCDNKCL